MKRRSEYGNNHRNNETRRKNKKGIGELAGNNERRIVKIRKGSKE